MKRVLRKAVELASPLLYEKFFFGSRGASWAGRKCAVSITFDVEYARDAKALKRTAELLDSYSVKGSFACIGKLVEQFPREHALIADEGHEIMNHTYSHPNHDVLNPAEFFNRLPREKQEWEIAEFEKTSKKNPRSKAGRLSRAAFRRLEFAKRLRNPRKARLRLFLFDGFDQNESKGLAFQSIPEKLLEAGLRKKRIRTRGTACHDLPQALLQRFRFVPLLQDFSAGARQGRRISRFVLKNFGNGFGARFSRGLLLRPERRGGKKGFRKIS